MLARNATANQSHTATNVHLDDDPGPAMVRGRGSNHSKAQNKSNRAIQIARQSLRVYARRHECMCVCASTCMAGCLPGRRAEHTRQWRSNERQRNSMPEEDLNKKASTSHELPLTNDVIQRPGVLKHRGSDTSQLDHDNVAVRQNQAVNTLNDLDELVLFVGAVIAFPIEGHNQARRGWTPSSVQAATTTSLSAELDAGGFDECAGEGHQGQHLVADPTVIFPVLVAESCHVEPGSERHG